MDLCIAVLFYCCCIVPALGSAFGREMPASTMDDNNDREGPFHYDYDSVRIVGLAFAAFFFFMGIFVAIGRKCRCKGGQK
ncbi:FXYD domain containing ion transport regulator 6 like isoform X2 [Electrophorus electricus]|uniref:FXYD domain containing ion transport regulator 6 like isoform X2 n=1 Tax=Electrophorus electricus TaxID=8005 RepID=UPI0015CFA080|nr:FXYD domain containing ion transport regulator 6 like isoform X2 [Electrophorus electricus]